MHATLRGLAYVLVLGAAILFSTSAPAYAQGRTYFYEFIAIDITIHPDTTFTVREELNFDFTGAYNVGWRNIPHQKIDDITDVAVYDGITGERLVYSPTRLEKTDPASWGKYTTYEENGETLIEWYYNVANTDYTWELVYTVHGGLGFYDEYDELYWNLFTDYESYVAFVEATIHLPSPTSLEQATWYTNEGANFATSELRDPQTYVFWGGGFEPGEDATIAAGWDKGIVDESAYWSGVWAKNWPYALAGIVFFLAVLICIIYWYITERHNAGRGTIITQFEPPRNLPPAMAEMLIRERSTSRAWPATIVDLATRGYIHIEEERKLSIGALVVYGAVIIFIGLAVLFLSGIGWNQAFLLIAILFLAFFVVLPFRLGIKLPKHVYPKDYILTKTDPLPDTSTLKEYERGILEIFLQTGPFSTRKLRTSSKDQQHLYRELKLLEKTLAADTDTHTGAYERSLVGEQKSAPFLVVVIMLSALMIFFGPRFGIYTPYAVLIAVTIISIATVYFFMKYEARLSKEGQVLREDWLGFKQYLMTAERYRLQNLTPEMFERYLPYAMIFGIEKKWAKAFSHVSMPPPQWYSGGIYAGGVAGSFSPGSFASGFSASFASTFASSGASGGGGGAGGGGGGGGGGAG